MKKRIAAISAAVCLAMCSTACSRGEEVTSEVTSEAQDRLTNETQPEAIETREYRRPIDLEAVYQAVLAEQPEDAEELVLFPETNREVIYSIYPNLENVDVDQILYYCPPVMGHPCEIIMIEAQTQRGSDYAYDVFLDRIDAGAADVDYPDNAEGWATRAEVHQEGVYVGMIVLPEGYEIPSNMFSLVD